VQGLGTFVDDIVVSTGEGTTSFETGLDGDLMERRPGSAPFVALDSTIVTMMAVCRCR
jgi:hypothetical protein